MHKRPGPFLKALIVLAMLLFPYAAHSKEKTLTILYTGALRGELEPCGCSPETQSGGLTRLSAYIKDNKEALSPYLLIDAGQAFAENTPQGRLKNEAVAKSFAIMRYDAVASDLRGAKRVAKGGIRANIAIDAKRSRKGMLNILLSERPVEELKAVNGWDVVISSSGEILEEPVSTGASVIVSGYPKGQKLGVLTLKLGGDGKVAAFSHRWQALKLDSREDQKVRAVLNEYDRKVARLLKEAELKPLAHGPYLGSAKCAECHQPFVESWSATRHARAFATIEGVGKSKDPECVKCHTVGYGEEGGFLSLKTTPGLANVQCESCHGPGREHATDFSPMRPIGREVCLKCHTPENSPLFDYPAYYDKIKH